MAPYVIRKVGDDDDAYYPTVARVTPMCPHCDRQRSRTIGHGRQGRIRYHRCLECGAKFRSIEVEAPEISEEEK